MKLLARHYTLIAIIGTAVLTIVYYVGVVCPGHYAAQAVKDEIAQAHAQMEALPLLLEERSRLQEQVAQQRKGLAAVDVFLPDASHESQILHEVANLGRESELVISRLEPLPSVKFASYSMHPFQLNCRGEFRDISAFLNALERRQRLVTFGRISLVPNNDSPAEGGEWLIHANVHFSVYSRHSNSTEVTENTVSRILSVSDN